MEVTLKYLIPTEILKKEKPYISSVPFTKQSSRISNFTEMSYKMIIQDVRDVESDFELNVNGFQFIKHEFQNHPDDKINGPDDPYLVEVAAVLKDMLQAKDVVIYDCNVRKIGNPEFFQAATSAHIDTLNMWNITPNADHTAGNALWRLREALARSRPNGISYDRWLAVTLWRPISNPVTDWPLGVCDFNSIEESDLHAVDTVLPHRVNEIYHLAHSPDHKWYYMSNQKPNEALVMKIFDSDIESATFSAHAAFDITKKGGEVGPPRHSADVRAFAFF